MCGCTEASIPRPPFLVGQLEEMIPCLNCKQWGKNSELNLCQWQTSSEIQVHSLLFTVTFGVYGQKCFLSLMSGTVWSNIAQLRACCKNARYLCCSEVST